MYDPSAWFTQDHNPLNLTLDAQNARLEIEPSSPQSWIRYELCEYEGVIELARSINEFGGLYPSDNIIACIENDNIVVLEGNRRVCALQLLLDSDLVPSRFRSRFPNPVEGVTENIETIPVQIAPSRADADVLIARLHAVPAKREWQPLAKMRYAERLYEENFTIDDIATNLSETRSQIRRLVRRYRIYQHALTLDWSNSELDRLRDERLKVTGYVRIFEKADARALIGDIFDNEGRVISPISKDTLNRHLKIMVQDFLLPQADGSNPPENTRTDLRQYLLKKHQELIEASQAAGATSSSSRSSSRKKDESYSSNNNQREQSQRSSSTQQRPGPAPSRFFENLHWVVNDDDKLSGLCKEIRRIRYHETPMAAAMLVRALLEQALRYHLKKKKLYNAFQSTHGKNDNLQNLIKFCADPKVGAFSEKRVANQLSNLQSTGIKDQLDCVIHNKFGEATPELLTGIVRPYCRPIIEHIVKNEEGL
jgi:hypothetical protein